MLTHFYTAHLGSPLNLLPRSTSLTPIYHRQIASFVAVHSRHMLPSSCEPLPTPLTTPLLSRDPERASVTHIPESFSCPTSFVFCRVLNAHQSHQHSQIIFLSCQVCVLFCNIPPFHYAVFAMRFQNHKIIRESFPSPVFRIVFPFH